LFYFCLIRLRLIGCQQSWIHEQSNSVVMFSAAESRNETLGI